MEKYEEVKKDLADIDIELKFFPGTGPWIYFNPISSINWEVKWEFISIK